MAATSTWHSHWAQELAAQGKPVDTGGYYLPDPAKAAAAMRRRWTPRSDAEPGEPAWATRAGFSGRYRALSALLLLGLLFYGENAIFRKMRRPDKPNRTTTGGVRSDRRVPRPVVWTGSSKGDISLLPREVKASFGSRL